MNLILYGEELLKALEEILGSELAFRKIGSDQRGQEEERPRAQRPDGAEMMHR